MKYEIIYNREQLNKALDDLQNCKLPVNFSFEEIENPKTIPQLKFFWGGIIKTLHAYFKDIGQTIEDDKGNIRPYNTTDVKLWLYHNTIGLEYIILPDGQVATCTKSMSQMKKKEMSKFINDCILLVDNDTDCILPPWIRTCWVNHTPDEYYNFLDTVKFPQLDNDYLVYQRKQACLYCGCRENIQAHHVKTNKYDGTAQKSPDWFTVSLCHKHHTDLHNGQDILSGIPLYNTDLELFCKLSYIKWLYKL